MNNYQDTIITIEVPSFGYNGHRDYLKFLTPYGSMTELENLKVVVDRKGRVKEVVDYRKQTRKVQFRFSHHYAYGVNSFLTSLKNIFRDGFLKVTTETVPSYDTGWDRLKEILGNFDWTYVMSDDPRYYHAGLAAYAEVKQLCKELTEIDLIRTKNTLELYYKPDDEWRGWLKPLINDCL